MTEALENYHFDFEKEANALSHSLGAPGANIIFAEVRVTLPEDISTTADVSEPKLAGPPKLLREIGKGTKKLVKQLYTQNPETSSKAYSLGENGHENVCHIIAMKENEVFCETLGPDNKQLMHLFTLYHETGHALMPEGPMVDNRHPFREGAADAYAALRLLQRFGPEAAGFLSRVSWARSLYAVLGDTSHLTCPILDRIVTDSAARDFSQLTHDETLALAREYAHDWTPKPSLLSRARRNFMQGADIDCGKLARTSLPATDKFSFYIGAKFFQPFLQAPGIVLNGQPVRLDRESRRNCTAVIKERAANMNLREIFGAAVGEKTKASVLKHLKVIRPAGRRPFIANI